MSLNIIRQDDQISIVALSGPLDAAAVDLVEVEFLHQTAGRHVPVVVDLSETSALMSQAMAMLTKCYTSLKCSGLRMAFLNPQDPVADTLRNVTLDQFIPIHFDHEDAVRYVTAPPSATSV